MEVKRIKMWLGAAVIAVVSPLTYMALDKAPPYEYFGGRVVPDPASSGTQVQVNWDLRVRRVCPGFIQRELVDVRGVVHHYDPVPARGNVAGNFWITFALPYEMPKGRTLYRARGTYWCNPLQYLFPIHTITPDIEFTLQ